MWPVLRSHWRYMGPAEAGTPSGSVHIVILIDKAANQIITSSTTGSWSGPQESFARNFSFLRNP